MKQRIFLTVLLSCAGFVSAQPMPSENPKVEKCIRSLPQETQQRFHEALWTEWLRPQWADRYLNLSEQDRAEMAAAKKTVMRRCFAGISPSAQADDTFARIDKHYRLLVRAVGGRLLTEIGQTFPDLSAVKPQGKCTRIPEDSDLNKPFSPDWFAATALQQTPLKPYLAPSAEQRQSRTIAEAAEFAAGRLFACNAAEDRQAYLNRWIIMDTDRLINPEF